MNGIDIYFQQLITFFYSITLFDKGLESFTVQSYGIHPDMNEHIAACFIGQGNSMTGRKQIFYHTVKRSHHNTVFRQDDHAFAQHLGGECLITTFTQRLNGARQGSCNFHFLKSHCGLFSSRGTLF